MSLAQCGHFVASSATVSLQYGHLRGSGAGGGGGGSIRFTCFIKINTAVATITKSKHVFKNAPYAITGAPASFAAANVSYVVLDKLI